MALVYRSMLPDNGNPKIGSSAKELGVRIPNDIVVSSSSFVSTNSGGMSVANHWKQLPPHRIPKRLRSLAPDAVGNDSLRCWRYGDGRFESGPFADDLTLNVTSTSHANVEPAVEMHLETYREALAATRKGWSIDER